MIVLKNPNPRVTKTFNIGHSKDVTRRKYQGTHQIKISPIATKARRNQGERSRRCVIHTQAVIIACNPIQATR